MTMRPYPSNIIIFSIDERMYTDDIKCALKRSWTHIGETLIRSHTSSNNEDPGNYIHVMVKYGTRAYLHSTDEDADANWSERMELHLLSTMRKISNNVVAFNRRQRKNDDPVITFDFIEFELEGGALTLEYHLDSNGCLPTTCAHIATDIRRELNEGSLGGPVRVRIPSARSYQKQALRAAEEKAEQAAEEAKNDEAAVDIDEGFIEAPELVAEIAEEEATRAQQDSPFEIAPLTEEEWEAEYGVSQADFEIDYSIWEAIYADGASREYDARVKQYVA